MSAVAIALGFEFELAAAWTTWAGMESISVQPRVDRSANCVILAKHAPRDHPETAVVWPILSRIATRPYRHSCQSSAHPERVARCIEADNPQHEAPARRALDLALCC